MGLARNDPKKFRKELVIPKTSNEKGIQNSLDKTRHRNFPSVGAGFQFVPDGAEPKQDLRVRPGDRTA